MRFMWLCDWVTVWLSPSLLCRVQDLEAHSKTCSSHSATASPKTSRKVSPAENVPNNSPRKPSVPPSTGEYLVVNVTRTPPGATELAPFKIITKVHSICVCVCVCVCVYMCIARKFRGLKFSWFSQICPPRKFNPWNYIYIIDNGNSIGIRENKMRKLSRKSFHENFTPWKFYSVKLSSYTVNLVNWEWD